MGAGSAYGYEHFILVDESEVAPGWVELEDGEECPGHVDEDRCWDEDEQYQNWVEFKDAVREVFNARKASIRDGDSLIIGQADRFDILWDSTGGYGALWLRAKLRTDPRLDYERYFKLDRIARNGFNKLIRLYERGAFLTPTSDYTSMAFGKNADGTTDLYVKPYSWWKHPPTDLKG